jgi:hypothetical protein
MVFVVAVEHMILALSPLCNQKKKEHMIFGT